MYEKGKEDLRRLYTRCCVLFCAENVLGQWPICLDSVLYNGSILLRRYKWPCHVQQFVIIYCLLIFQRYYFRHGVAMGIVIVWGLWMSRVFGLILYFLAYQDTIHYLVICSDLVIFFAKFYETRKQNSIKLCLYTRHGQCDNRNTYLWFVPWHLKHTKQYRYAMGNK